MVDARAASGPPSVFVEGSVAEGQARQLGLDPLLLCGVARLGQPLGEREEARPFSIGNLRG